ncbi:RNA polymerase sigma-70 factor (ECF subfamily) [Tahibacter aquaticus]|jgi:RNA polymerase sigma-70 factor (ECF subfamily)|uniref:RNA polymerase sigma-70 factor (ECF subfamily) n=1 Tax=Tahibacter aquaticus TaxID=520092 RepID=A0A4V3DNJ3_9GAMM|nr:sigma-70 family RNA polymerase sigma factor [Tahibacter aquaticus]TDR48636.1 RNA polymerase sigma-70 factor (ECF subfamily) [Tahibacter aquaticus]
MTRDEPTLALFSATPRTALFDRFVMEQRQALLGFLGRLNANQADAEDIAQESFLSLVRYRDQEPVESWRPLLFRIALNAWNDRRRRQHTRSDLTWLSLQEVGTEQVPSSDVPHDKRISDQQELALIRDTILQLPQRCRQVYLLNRIEGMSYSEIARHCGISVKAVEKHIAKALVTLRERVARADMSTGEAT